MTWKADPEADKTRIDEIAEELAGNPSSKGRSIIKLRKLCGRHLTVPTSYTLEDVVKEGDCAQRISQVAEIWRGMYSDEVVALKVLRVARDDPRMQRNKSRFCKEVVLMKQLQHDNILPFYGVSTTVSDFCLVFPWYENGNIMDYLKNKPGADRFDLLSGVANGLCFLHDNRLVHGDLRPSHILIDDDGAARLATAGRSSIVAIPNTSVASHIQSGLDEGVDKYRYSAPEICDDSRTDKILITKESDVYGIAMVAYEILTGDVPYSDVGNHNALLKIQAGEKPRRPSEGFADPVWQFLEACWSRDPAKRPPTIRVFDAFSDPRSLPRVGGTEGLSSTGELPRKLKLQVQSIKLALSTPKQRQFSLKFKYRNKNHTIPLTRPLGGSDEHTWKVPESWIIETNRQHHGQPVSIGLVLPHMLKKDEVYATGDFSLLNIVNKEASVRLEAPDGAGSVVLKIFLVPT